MTPLIGAGLAILLLCLLLVCRIPMIVAIMAVVFFANFMSGAWMLTLPQTMMSGIGRVVPIGLPRFVPAGCPGSPAP